MMGYEAEPHTLNPSLLWSLGLRPRRGQDCFQATEPRASSGPERAQPAPNGAEPLRGPAGVLEHCGV